MKSLGFDDVVLGLPVAGSGKTPTLTSRKSENRRASVESIGEQGLRSGVVVRYQDHFYVVKSIGPDGMDLVVLNGRLQVTHKLPVVATNGSGTPKPLVTVEYLPRKGFVHARSVTYASMSILAKGNAAVLRALQAKLGKDDVYKHPTYGTFWRAAKVAAFKKWVWQRSEARAVG